MKAGDAKNGSTSCTTTSSSSAPKMIRPRSPLRRDARPHFKAIADTKATFVSRGDKSGTNTKELTHLVIGQHHAHQGDAWYNRHRSGHGRHAGLQPTRRAATPFPIAAPGWLPASKLPNLMIVVGGNTLAENKDKILLNPYGIMAVNPDKHPGVQYDEAMQFLHWFNSADTKKYRPRSASISTANRCSTRILSHTGRPVDSLSDTVERLSSRDCSVRSN